MLSGTIFPAHPKPLPDEILTSWLVRIAQANGIKLSVLTQFGLCENDLIWRKDIDRYCPNTLAGKISEKTSVPIADIKTMTMEYYLGRLFETWKDHGPLRWILPVGSYGTKRRGPGIQFCSMCLSEDPTPYFRKSWRLALNFFCPKHQVMLFDSCPGCGNPISLHRMDTGIPIYKANPLSHCAICKIDWRDIMSLRSPEEYSQVWSILTKIHQYVILPGTLNEDSIDDLNTIHKACGLGFERQKQTSRLEILKKVSQQL